MPESRDPRNYKQDVRDRCYSFEEIKDRANIAYDKGYKAGRSVGQAEGYAEGYLDSLVDAGLACKID